jgi:peptide/nickel transport system ATP-binding protein
MARFQEGWKGPVLECRNLCISYMTRAADIPAVVNFNLTLNRSETVGLVGESGCGKSTVAMAIMRYLGHNGRIASGQVIYKGVDMATLSAEQIRRLRGSEIAMVYQEPMASLNPSMK